MNIAITTPTGHIGSKLTERLVETKKEITLIARYPEKLNGLKKRNVRIVEGTHDDPKIVREATRGADALFWLTPPNFTVDDIRSYYQTFGRAAARAIDENKIPFVVHLSSLGADLDAGTGPVLGLHDNERILNDAAENIVHLRPGYFMENLLMQIPALKEHGKIFTTFNGATKIPMIATFDIAKRAFEILSDFRRNGHHVVELHGPGAVSYDEVADALSEILKRKITHVQITPQQSEQLLISMGVSAHVAEMFNDLAASVENGAAVFREPRSESNSTETSLPVFLKKFFKPIYDA